MFYSAFVLNSSLPVAEAVERLTLHGPRTRVVVRRQLGYQLFFYPFTVAELLQRLQGLDSTWSLRDALNLHETDSAPTITAAGTGERGVPSVVLDGEHVLGVLDEPQVQAGASVPDMAPPAPARQHRSRGASRERRTHRAARAPEADVRDDVARRIPWSDVEYELGVRGEPSRSEAGAIPAVREERFEAFPLVEAPEKVAPGERFHVTIGLSRSAIAEVLGGPVVATVSSGSETMDFTVLVAADGFSAPEGWRRTLIVAVAQPDAARVTIPLVAEPLTSSEPRLSFLLVHFSSRGEACGMASRKIIVRDPAVAEIPVIAGGRPWLGAPQPAPVIAFDARQTPPDLTIRLAKPDQDEGSGKFVMSFESPHAIHISEPGVFTINLGKDVQTFTRGVIESANQHAGRATIGLALRGEGKTISAVLPPAFRDVLQQVWGYVHDGQQRIPTLLLLSAEAYVPWELALLDPPFDAARPPFVGAQFVMSRWVLGARDVPLPPPREVAVRRMAVVAGDYKSAKKIRPLPEAIEEGKALAKKYGAIALQATSGDLTALLDAQLPDNGTTSGVDAIHFACHGEVDPTNALSGRIYLDDASFLSCKLFHDAKVGKTNGPFLFLNACQVAQAGELLNEYGGFAGYSLGAGFRGFVAPLWNVSDRVAREIAVEFYQRAFAAPPDAPESVAGILRDIRAKYLAQPGGIPQATYLAYVFYGHPNLLLSRQG